MIARLRVGPALGRTSALLVALALALVAAFQIYWAFGGTWGMSEALGREIDDPSSLLRLASGAVAVFLVGAVLVVLARVEVWRGRVPTSLARWGPWILTVLLVFMGLNNLAADTSWERFAFGPFALVLALLSALVALSPSPAHPTDRREMARQRVETQAG
jgi:hypothetical protein